MNEEGVSFVETILSVVILFVLTSGLIPMTHQLRTTLHNKKLEAHASEVALNGALLAQQYSVESGVQAVDEVVYTWTYQSGEICVEFTNLLEERRKCIDQYDEKT